jgi:hypothetical protein
MTIEYIIASVVGLIILYLIISYQIKENIKKGTYYLTTNYKGLEDVESEICEHFYAIYYNRIQKFVTSRLIFEPAYKGKKLNLVEVEGYIKDDLLQEDIIFKTNEISNTKEKLIKKLAEK